MYLRDAGASGDSNAKPAVDMQRIFKVTFKEGIDCDGAADFAAYGPGCEPEHDGASINIPPSLVACEGTTEPYPGNVCNAAL